MVIVVTGGSSGIGREIAFLLSQYGHEVYEFSRSGRDFEKVVHIDCDITDKEAIKLAISQVINRSNRIDVLVNNAGIGISGAVEFTSEEDIRRIFDVNLIGSVLMNQAVIPYMRKNKFGRIINISSMAADIAIPFQSFYSATKSALLSLTLAMHAELHPFNIKVTAILPGDTATKFTESRKKDHSGNEFYNGRIDRSVSRMERDELSGMSSYKAAKLIVRIIRKKHLKPRYIIGFKYKVFSILFRILPYSLSSFIVRVLYAK